MKLMSYNFLLQYLVKKSHLSYINSIVAVQSVISCITYFSSFFPSRLIN